MADVSATLIKELRDLTGAGVMDCRKALEEAMKLKTPAEVIDYLYLTTLSRHPTAAETQRLVGYVGKQKDARTGYTDILWALLNSSEFSLNH